MVTHTHSQSLEQIKDDPENWFAKLHPSDKAYAVTQRVNNERVWAWTYEKKKRENENKSTDETTDKSGEEGKEASQRVPTTRNANKTKRSNKQPKKKTGKRKKVPVQPEIPEGDEINYNNEAPKRRWTMTGKQRYGGSGLSAGGVKFYEKILRSMKQTHFGSDEWQELWNGFWEKEKGKYIKQKRAVMPETWNLENDTGVDGGDGLFDEGDGLNDEEEADGWVMEM